MGQRNRIPNFGSWNYTNALSLSLLARRKWNNREASMAQLLSSAQDMRAQQGCRPWRGQFVISRKAVASKLFFFFFP